MKFRWTIQDCQEKNDDEIIRGILSERISDLNYYSPLAKRLNKIREKLNRKIRLDYERREARREKRIARKKPSLEAELRDAWEGQGNSRNITFDAWLAEMADNDNGILTYAARMFIEETTTAIGNSTRRIVPMMESEATHA